MTEKATLTSHFLKRKIPDYKVLTAKVDALRTKEAMDSLSKTTII